MILEQIILNNEFRRFIIVADERTFGIKLDDDEIDDGYIVLDDIQDTITEKAFKSIDFILLNGTGERELKYAMYDGKNDSVNVQSVSDKSFNTGSAQEYAKGLEEDTPEIKAKKLQAILDLTAFKRMCVEILNR